jgi:hypothetical protein
MKTFSSRPLALAAALLSVVVLINPAVAAKKKEKDARPAYDLPMRVVIVRNAMGGCEPLCPQWISAEGQITSQTPALFKKTLAKAKNLRLPIIVTSPGGEVDAALKIGEMIRAYGGDVAVGFTYFGGCAPHQKGCKLPSEQKGVYRGTVMSGYGFCVSACAFLLAAGEKRVMSPGTAVGVHQISRTITREKVQYFERYRIVNGKKKILSRKIVARKPMKSYVSTKLDRRLKRKLDGFFAKMGVDKSVLGLFDKAPPSSMYILSLPEAKNTKLVTDVIPAVDLIAVDRCKTNPPAANCVLIEDEHAALEQ